MNPFLLWFYYSIIFLVRCGHFHTFLFVRRHDYEKHSKRFGEWKTLHKENRCISCFMCYTTWRFLSALTPSYKTLVLIGFQCLLYIGSYAVIYNLFDFNISYNKV